MSDCPNPECGSRERRVYCAGCSTRLNDDAPRLRGLLKEAAGAAIYYRDQLRLYEGNRFEGHAIHDATLAKLAKEGL